MAPMYEKIAKEDLHEDDKTREEALAQMREWIINHPHIKTCRTDAPFLLRFLRTKKFSVPIACDQLEQYLVSRQLYAKWYGKLDVEDPEIEALIDAGYSFPLLERDAEGRRVFLSIVKHFDASRFTAAHMARLHALVVEAHLDEEESQVAGYVHCYDATGLGIKHLGLWSLADVPVYLKRSQYIAPMRHRGVNLAIGFIHKILEFVISMLTEKIRKRVKVTKSMQGMKELVDPKILPLEYGGSIPMKDMIAIFKEKLKRQRAKLLILDEMRIVLNKNGEVPPIPSVSGIGTDASVIGNFKKLELD